MCPDISDDGSRGEAVAVFDGVGEVAVAFCGEFDDFLVNLSFADGFAALYEGACILKPLNIAVCAFDLYWFILAGTGLGRVLLGKHLIRHRNWAAFFGVSQMFFKEWAVVLKTLIVMG